MIYVIKHILLTKFKGDKRFENEFIAIETDHSTYQR